MKQIYSLHTEDKTQRKIIIIMENVELFEGRIKMKIKKKKDFATKLQ